MSAWQVLVKKTFKELKAKNPHTTLKDALLAAKKVYRKGSPSKTRKGRKDFTTKKGSKVFHRKGKYVRKSRRPYTKKR